MISIFGYYEIFTQTLVPILQFWQFLQFDTTHFLSQKVVRHYCMYRNLSCHLDNMLKYYQSKRIRGWGLKIIHLSMVICENIVEYYALFVGLIFLLCRLLFSTPHYKRMLKSHFTLNKHAS